MRDLNYVQKILVKLNSNKIFDHQLKQTKKRLFQYFIVLLNTFKLLIIFF